MSKGASAKFGPLVRSLSGEYFRHVPARRQRPATQPSQGGGRWGQTGVSVLYLGRPRDSVVAEAYRLLVAEDMQPDVLLPRTLYTITVNLANVVDLTGRGFAIAGLDEVDLNGPHERCASLAAEVVKEGHEGLLVPAATGIGETLALYPENFQADSSVEILRSEDWHTLPSVPSHLAEGSESAQSEPYIDADKLAWRLGGIDRSSINDWRKQGMPSLQLSKRRFVYRFSEVERWLKGRRW